MSYYVEPIIVNTNNLTTPAPAKDLWDNRVAAYNTYDAPGAPKCSIWIMGFNRLEKTKYCVECVMNYTQEIDYELILVDNGSEDGTYEYFQTVPFDNKKIIKVTKNIGAFFPMSEVLKVFTGKYLVIVPNDVYVTKNWLDNLLKCYESDKSIGFVVPVSSNVSNLQQIDLNFKSNDDMQKKAAAYNQSDPLKWDERCRLISIISIFSRHVLDTVGVFDSAFIHDFSEDDLCIRLRRNGYKLILCKDTWVCHDHDFRNMEDKDPEKFQQTLESGRNTYREKHFGIDAWDDINNFEFTLLEPLDKENLPKDRLTILCAEARCGTPMLEARNRLRKRGLTIKSSYAFTSQAKYYQDLQTIADDVKCERVDFLQACYANDTFDIIIFCEPINTYSSPITLLQRLYSFLKPGGMLLFKLRNTDDFNTILRAVGIGGMDDNDLPAVLPLNQVRECLKIFGGKNIYIVPELHNLDEEDKKTLLALLRSIKQNADNNDLIRVLTKDYCFKVIKG